MPTHHRAVGGYVLAATAEIQGLELTTLNVKHYPTFPRLKAPLCRVTLRSGWAQPDASLTPG